MGKRDLMPRKTLLFKISGRSATFRIADTQPPLEEVSTTGEGTFNGMKFRDLNTIRVTPGRRLDRIDGRGILFVQGGSRAYYSISGVAGGGPEFSEVVKGTMVFGANCIGKLKVLKKTRASFEILVDSKGRFKTRVWRK